MLIPSVHGKRTSNSVYSELTKSRSSRAAVARSPARETIRRIQSSGPVNSALRITAKRVDELPYKAWDAAIGGSSRRYLRRISSTTLEVVITLTIKRFSEKHKFVCDPYLAFIVIFLLSQTLGASSLMKHPS